MENYKQLKQILSKAEEFEELDPVYWDGEDLLDQWGYLCHHPFCKSENTSWRNLNDIQKIVDLMEKVALAQVYTDKILGDLGDE